MGPVTSRVTVTVSSSLSMTGLLVRRQILEIFDREDLGDAVIHDNDRNLFHGDELGRGLRIKITENLFDTLASSETAGHGQLSAITNLLPIVARHEGFGENSAMHVVNVDD